jgi:hypothetical protein
LFFRCFDNPTVFHVIQSVAVICDTGRIFGLPYSLETHCEMVLTPTSMRSVIIILCTSVTLESSNIILTQTLTRGCVTYTAVVIQCVVQHTVACYKERDENELTDEY